MIDLVFTLEMGAVIFVQSRLPDAGGRARCFSVTLADGGLSLGDGALEASWADMIAFLISRITVLGVPAPATRPTPRQVTFPEARGRRYPARHDEWLARDETHDYLVSVKKGQQLRATLDGFAGRKAVLQGLRRGGERRAARFPRGERRQELDRQHGVDTAIRVRVVRLAPCAIRRCCTDCRSAPLRSARGVAAARRGSGSHHVPAAGVTVVPKEGSRERLAGGPVQPGPHQKATGPPRSPRKVISSRCARCRWRFIRTGATLNVVICSFPSLDSLTIQERRLFLDSDGGPHVAIRHSASFGPPAPPPQMRARRSSRRHRGWTLVLFVLTAFIGGPSALAAQTPDQPLRH